MPKNEQPTSEELKEKDEKLQEELEVLSEEHKAGEAIKPEKPEEEVAEEPEEEVAEEPEEEVAEEPEKEADEPEPEVETVDEPEEEVKAPKPDLKKRYKASTQEAQILHSKNKKFTDAFKEVRSVTEPTEDEMKAEYPEWEDMSDLEKKLSKEAVKNARRFEAIDKIGEETESAENWGKEVGKFLEDPQVLIDNPKLEGKLEGFEKFANKQSRRGTDMEDLIKAFLYDAEENKPDKKKGKMFSTGTGGPNAKKPKPKKMTIEEGAKLRDRDYSAYQKALIAGKIEDF